MVIEKTPVVILGAGGYAKVVFEILSTHSDLNVIGCTDKALGLSERSPGEEAALPILGDDDVLPDLAAKYFGLRAVIALGPELVEARRRLIRILDLENISPITARHRTAVISTTAKLGAGTVARAGSIVSAGTTVGRHCILSLGASIDHDSRLGDNVFVGQGAKISSYAEIADHVVVEMGAKINSRVQVGEGARITGSAFVNTDVPDHAVVVGAPGRVVRYLDG